MRALILEGGAMRGIFTAGALDGFAEGNEPPFDLVIGVSSGAYCAASYLSGQHGRIRRIIENHMTSTNYANPFRLLWGGSAIDQDFLMGPVTKELDPLDIDALRASSSRFEVIATHARTGRASCLPAQGEDCLDAIHATVAVPFFYKGGPIHFRGMELFDGSVSDPIPLRRALALGATSCTLVLTRSVGDIPDQASAVLRAGMGLIFRKHPAIARALARRRMVYADVFSYIEQHPDDIELRVISPPPDFAVSRFTRDRDRVIEGYELGKQRGTEAVATAG